MRARADLNLGRDVPDLLLRASVRTPLVDRDLLADEVLVDRFGRTLDELPRLRVLDRRLALGRSGTHREGQLDLLEDPVEEQVALCGAKLLRVLLRVGQLAEVAEELLAERPFDGSEPRASRGSQRSSSESVPASSCPPRSSSSRLPVTLLDERLDDGARLLDAVPGDRCANGLAVRCVELGR